MTTKEAEILKFVRKRISSLRKNNDLTQVDVCAQINMDKTNLSAIENGRQNVTSFTLLNIANAIGVEVSEFFTIPNTSTKSNYLLLSLIDKLSIC